MEREATTHSKQLIELKDLINSNTDRGLTNEEIVKSYAGEDFTDLETFSLVLGRIQECSTEKRYLGYAEICS